MFETIKQWFPQSDTGTKVSFGFFKRVVAYLKPYWAHVILSIITMAVVAWADIRLPSIYREMLDDVLPTNNVDLMLSKAGELFFIMLLSITGGVLEGWLVTYIGENVSHDIRGSLFHHLQFIPLNFFTHAHSVGLGKFLSLFHSDLRRAQATFSVTAPRVILSLFRVGFAFWSLYNLFPKLALVALCAFPVLYIPSALVGSRLRTQRREALREQHAMVDYLNEALTPNGALATRGLRREAKAIGEFTKISNQVQRAVLALAVSVGSSVIMGGGSILVFPPTISSGRVVALTQLVQKIFGQLANISNIQVDFLQASVSFSHLFSYMDEHPIPEEKDLTTVTNVFGEMSAENACFSYPADSETNEPGFSIENLTVTASPGQRIALVGPNGSGKSTAALILSGLLPQQKGSVLLDGRPVRSYDSSVLGNTVGVLAQNGFILNASIRDNVVLAKPNATAEEVDEALQSAFCEFVFALPNGLDTLIGKDGTRLSGGQRQRLLLARLVLQDPKVIILDEFRQGLEPKTRDKIGKRLLELFSALQSSHVWQDDGDRTMIVVTHFIDNFVRTADKVLAMNQGIVVESGTHDDLIKENGYYKNFIGEFEEEY